MIIIYPELADLNCKWRRRIIIPRELKRALHWSAPVEEYISVGNFKQI